MPVWNFAGERAARFIDHYERMLSTNFDPTSLHVYIGGVTGLGDDNSAYRLAGSYACLCTSPALGTPWYDTHQNDVAGTVITIPIWSHAKCDEECRHRRAHKARCMHERDCFIYDYTRWIECTKRQQERLEHPSLSVDTIRMYQEHISLPFYLDDALRQDRGRVNPSLWVHDAHHRGNQLRVLHNRHRTLKQRAADVVIKDPDVCLRIYHDRTQQDQIFWTDATPETGMPWIVGKVPRDVLFHLGDAMERARHFR